MINLNPAIILKTIMILLFFPAFINYFKYARAKFYYFKSITQAYKSIVLLQKLDDVGEKEKGINELNRKAIIYFVILILLQIINMNLFE